MKSKITSFIFLLIIIILITGIAIIGKAVYTDIFMNGTENTIIKLDSIATEDISNSKNENNRNNYSNVSLSEGILYDSNSATAKNITNDFFYNQLTENQKIIYNKFLSNKDNLKKGNYVIDFGNSFSSVLSKENGSEQLKSDYQTAIEAFTNDNMDVFYINVNKMYLNIETETKMFKTTYKVYISAENDGTYWADGFSSYDEIEQASNDINNIKNAIISNLNGTDYQNVLYIHDYLVNNIEYDSTYEAKGSYGIYGALIGKTCVCEGYAKAFKLLANEAGYKCELMQGNATNSSGENESHAWNCIQINGIWYEVDVTWDDPIIIGNGKIGKDIKYKYFLKGSDVFDKDHFLSNQLSDNGKVFIYPTMSKDNY